MGKQNAIQHAETRRQATYDAFIERQKVAKLDDGIRQRERQITADVANEVGADMKPVFSNADKRAAEVATRCLGDRQNAEMKRDREAAELEAMSQSGLAQFSADMLAIELAFPGV
jgi:hypothetical protein